MLDVESFQYCSDFRFGKVFHGLFFGHGICGRGKSAPSYLGTSFRRYGYLDRLRNIKRIIQTSGADLSEVRDGEVGISGNRWYKNKSSGI